MPEWPASVVTSVDRPSAEDLAKVALPAATLHEAMGRTGALPSAIKPIDPAMRVCGPAVTVSCPAGDNLRLHHAIYVAEPGDVLVVDVSGGHEFGYWGEVMAVAAIARGVGGLVIDGGVRDGDRLAELGFPVFARGRCIRGTDKDPTRGTINHPVLLGDVEVRPGDVVVGDADGVVVVPRAEVRSAAESGRAREAKEAGLMERLAAGATTPELFGFDPAELA